MSAETDLDHLGRWLPAIIGTALPLPDGDDIDTGGRVDAGRPEGVDDELARAVATLHKLDALYALPGGDAFVYLLAFAFLYLGPHGAARLTGEHLYEDDVEATGTLTARASDCRVRAVGLVFAEPDERMAWLLAKPPSFGVVAARNRGTATLAPALAAWGALGPEATQGARRPRVPMSAVLDWCSRLTRAVEPQLRQLVRARNLTAGRAPEPVVLAEAA